MVLRPPHLRLLVGFLTAIPFAAAPVARAEGCGERLRSKLASLLGPPSRPYEPGDVLAAAKRFDALEGDGSALLGAPLSIEDTLGWAISQMPLEARASMTEAAERFADQQLSVKPSKAPQGTKPARGELDYPNRFKKPAALQRANGATVRWPEGPVRSVEDLRARAELAIDLVTESRLVPIRPLTVLRAKPSRFISGNVDAIAEGLVQKLYLLQASPPPDRVPMNQGFQQALKLAKTYAIAQLPAHFASMKIGLNVDEHVVAIMNQEGPPGIYRYIQRTQGPALAAKYWATQLGNARNLITLATLAAVAPQLWDGYQHFASKQELPFASEEEKQRTLKVIAERDQTPERTLEEIDKNLEKLPGPAEEKDELRELMRQMREEAPK